MNGVSRTGAWAAAALAAVLILTQAPGCRKGAGPEATAGPAAIELPDAQGEKGEKFEEGPEGEQGEEGEEGTEGERGAADEKGAEGATELPLGRGVPPGRGVTDADLDEALAGGVVLVELYSPDCPACRVQMPTVDELAREYDGRARVLKIDTDRNRRAAHRFRVEFIPTLVVLKDGRTMRRMVGLQSKAELKAELDRALD